MKRMRLIQVRKENDLTQAEVAELVGLRSDAHISMIETGVKDPSLDIAQKLGQLFDTPVEELLAFSEVTASDVVPEFNRNATT